MMLRGVSLLDLQVELLFNVSRLMQGGLLDHPRLDCQDTVVLNEIKKLISNRMRDMNHEG